MNLRIRIAAAALAAAALPALAAPSAHAVIGGQVVAPGAYPFVAQIDRSVPYGTCTGALVAPSFVLTGTQCASTAQPGSVRVRVGNVNRDAGGQIRVLSRIIRVDHNLSLLELATPITNIAPVPIAPLEASAATSFVAWGATTVGGAPTSNLRIAPTVALTCRGDIGAPAITTYNGRVATVGVLISEVCGSNGTVAPVGVRENAPIIQSYITKRPYTFFGAADWDNDGHKDLIVRQESTGDLLLHPGTSNRGYSTQGSVKIGNGWQGYTPFGIGDWDRDGYQDIIARHDPTGEMRLFPGIGARGYSNQGWYTIGRGYEAYTPFAIADWDRDGYQDILARDDYTGALMAHFGQGKRAAINYDWVTVLTGLQNHTPFGVADYTGDGRLDVLTRTNDDGQLYAHPGNGARALIVTSRLSIGSGFAGYSSFGATDWDRDGKVDLIVRRDADTRMYLIRNGAWFEIGNGY